tara:strand:+ start:347 stop:526 length:180 start_codon:yes stop_codon:yes gene_type:complete
MAVVMAAQEDMATIHRLAKVETVEPLVAVAVQGQAAIILNPTRWVGQARQEPSEFFHGR